MSSLLQRSRCHITLPLTVDVLDYILSFLESDPKALEACCISHPLLCQIAHPHIYANIYLRTSNLISYSNFGPYNLAKLLSDRPHIANYIRNLYIRVSGDSNENIGPFLQEISTVFPKLLALKKITLDHRSTHTSFCWESQPKSFRIAFLGCLRSESVQHVCIRGISYFPFTSVWNGESRTIKSLTLTDCFKWHEASNQAPTLDTNSSPPIESLAVRRCGGDFLENFSGLVKTFRMHFRSLKFSQDHYKGYDPLPSLLSCSSSFLTSLDLDIGRNFSTLYDVGKPTLLSSGTIPIKLSTLPYLERLTIRSQLEYIYNRFSTPIPAITRLLSASDTSSLQCVTLDFNFTYNGGAQPLFHPWLSFVEDVCLSFVRLLTKVARSSGAASSAPTRVCFCINGKATSPTLQAPNPKPIPPHVILSSFAVCGELMQFVHQGMLVVTPPIPIQNVSPPVDDP